VQVAVAGAVVIWAVVQLTASIHAQAYQWWHDAKVQRELELTSDQVKDLEGVFVPTLSDRQRLRRELDRLEEYVQQIIARADLDEALVSASIDQLEAARAKRNASRTLMLYKMYRILSPPQRRRLARMRHAAERIRQK